MNRGVRMKPRRTEAIGRVLEKTEQAHIIELTVTIGGKVITIGGPRRGSACPDCGAWVGGHRGTQQTEGLADLEMFLPVRDGRRKFLKWETKSLTAAKKASGGLSPDQQRYRDLCLEAGVLWGSGTFADYERFLADLGYVKAQWIPHYRQPSKGRVQA